MQKFTPKLWAAAGLAVAAVAATPQVATAADEPAPYKAPEEMFPGNYDRALQLMLAGEGGEAGIGMHRVWPTVSVPALSTEQIQKAVPGNSLAIQYHYTMHMKPDGTIGGYHLAWADTTPDKCPKKEVLNDGFLLHDGKCSTRKEMPWTGKWKVADNKICIDLFWENNNKLSNCYTMYFMLDSVALVEPDGRLWGKAHKLKKGYQPDEG